MLEKRPLRLNGGGDDGDDVSNNILSYLLLRTQLFCILSCDICDNILSSICTLITIIIVHFLHFINSS